ncbi:MAG TPA: hypothetical protein VFK06_11440 [Candidatus Angelobacter sp.]|nr:hypothetical protein [Candidatus Angelobacter sp.]
MPRTHSDIERLDLAARVQYLSGMLSRWQVGLSLLALLTVFLAFVSTADRHETWLIRIVAGCTVMAAVILCLTWRYKVYALALMFFIWAALNMFSHDHPAYHTVFGWFAAHSLTPMFICWGCASLIAARRYAVVYGPGWQAERGQVEEWCRMLKRPDSGPIAEFILGSFWKGIWTYRILNAGDCWVIARLTKHSRRIVDCRVYELHQVTFTRLANEKWKIAMKHKQFTGKMQRSLPPEFDSLVRQDARD